MEFGSIIIHIAQIGKLRLKGRETRPVSPSQQVAELGSGFRVPCLLYHMVSLQGSFLSRESDPSHSREGREDPDGETTEMIWLRARGILLGDGGEEVYRLGPPSPFPSILFSPQFFYPIHFLHMERKVLETQKTHIDTPTHSDPTPPLTHTTQTHPSAQAQRHTHMEVSLRIQGLASCQL